MRTFPASLAARRPCDKFWSMRQEEKSTYLSESQYLLLSNQEVRSNGSILLKPPVFVFVLFLETEASPLFNSKEILLMRICNKQRTIALIERETGGCRSAPWSSQAALKHMYKSACGKPLGRSSSPSCSGYVYFIWACFQMLILVQGSEFSWGTISPLPWVYMLLMKLIQFWF